MSIPTPRLLLRSFGFGSHVCRACQRGLATSARLQSGHNKWSTIKHDKAKKDAQMTKQRSSTSHAISLAVKLGGPDPNLNPRLALAIQVAKKASIPKNIIEQAVRRGQGVSATGAALEPVTLEAMLPGSVAVMIDCEAESRNRTLADLRLVVKRAGGNASSVSFMFTRKGRIEYKAKEGVDSEQILEAALEAGALDVEDGEDGATVVFAEPSETKAVAEKVAQAVGLEIDQMDILWVPNEDTQVALSTDEEAEELTKFVDQLKEVAPVLGVQAVYWNCKQGGVSDAAWEELVEKVEDF
ncbi:transcriptional regulator TACO1-like protein [Phyllosticta citrichinensis]|uniref:Transcriptional regulator TACO1-like protein n=1 Tax=Phyllosticta citrichinensis TaxID=1130410 RepID=A0ABR1XM71_9PEZI